MIFLDIDECSLEVDTCDDNADCTDIDGSYMCTCLVGFTGDGETCCTYLTHNHVCVCVCMSVYMYKQNRGNFITWLMLV